MKCRIRVTQNNRRNGLCSQKDPPPTKHQEIRNEMETPTTKITYWTYIHLFFFLPNNPYHRRQTVHTTCTIHVTSCTVHTIEKQRRKQPQQHTTTNTNTNTT
mmetsp:Transcript_2153/g.2360  ORF Transcript_2153/g.2360 Transcript_2153/m.2360 type:complete len:102 (+) Transcript_2153:74-379(+)